MKYYETSRGQILIDGQSIKTLDTDWLRSNIHLVHQDSFLFNETIFRNIALGKRDDVTHEDVLEAAKTADLGRTLMDLPQGLDTVVGSNGKSLSGGQQQRIAIARAHLRDAPILILDESTSALDTTSRAKVMGELRKWRRGKTTIIVTHDVDQIPDDDYVYVLEKGMVVQEGYRSKLAEKDHGTFSAFLSPISPPQVHNAKFRDLTDQRRKSEPASPTPTSADSFEFAEEAINRSNRISRLFGMTNSVPSMRANNRMSLGAGMGAAQVMELRADKIWSTPVIPENPTTQSHESWRSNAPLLSQRPSQPPTSSYSRFHSPEIPPPVPRKNNLPLSSNPPSPPRFKPVLPALDTSIRDSKLQVVEDPILPVPQNPGRRKDRRAFKPASLTQILGTIWPVLKWKDRMILIVGFVAAFLVAASTPAFAFVFAKLLGTFYLKGNQEAVAKVWALSLLGIAIVDGLSVYTTHYTLEYCGQAWVNSLRVEAFKRILTQPKSWFDKERNSPGKLNECLDRNAEEMRNLIGRFAGPIFTVVWMLGISIVWSLMFSWKLTFVALACGPIMLVLTRVFDSVSSTWEDRCNRASEIASGIFTETFSNIRVVRALTLENYLARKHNKATLETYRTGRSRAIYSGLVFGLTDSASLFITALVFYYATVIIIRGENNVSNIIQVVNLLLFGIANSAAMIAMVPQINSSRTTATHMLYLANLPYQNSHETLGKKRLSTPFPIKLTNLSFTYPSRRSNKCLNKINLTIDAGTCTALVGPSGSGKSTIASILLALYPPDPSVYPSLTFSGTAISDCNIRTLRSFISIVPQTPLLFPASIYDNIIYGLPEGSPFATFASAVHAASDAGIHDFISSLETGYHTLIGDGGMGLSGGQAQRIAIARALVRRPKLLILDEATSALDAVSAEAIRETVRKLMERGRESEEGGMAVLIISHNVEMMRVADTVVMIEDGRVVESGSFRELRGRGGKFAALIGSVREKDVDMERVITPVRGRNRMTWRKGSA